MEIKERHIRGEIVAIKLALLGGKKKVQTLSGTKEGVVHLPVEMRPAPQTAGLSVERQRERGVRGSTGN